MKERKSAAAPIVACLFATVAFLLVAYVGGYFLLQMGPADVTSVGATVRIYRFRWMGYAFYPAGCVERLATGHGVQLVSGDGLMLFP